MNLILVQILNGLQYGLLLFLLAAGLTLVLGIMRFVNLAHGAFYMLGAYLGAAAFAFSGFYVVAGLFAVLATLAIGFLVDRLILFRFYSRSYLYQVLITFGLILVLNETVRMIWGPQPLYIQTPAFLSGTVSVVGATYPIYRFVVIGAGLLVALGLYLTIYHTRIGMLIRAGASNSRMVSMLGINIRLLNAIVFGAGAALAGLSGFLAAPILTVQPGMGDDIMIVVLVIIVIGGIGSIRGAFYAALLVGVVETVGRTYLPTLLRSLTERTIADAAGPAISSMLIYLLMTLILAFRPQGLFPVRK